MKLPASHVMRSQWHQRYCFFCYAARERERGALEAFLGTPLRSFELWAARLAPYVLFGVLQAVLIVAFGALLFDNLVTSSVALLAFGTLTVIVANLALAFLFSCLARQKMQAMQMTLFSSSPSLLLSGFMFPFSAMPRWAQKLAETLPFTHFLRIVAGKVLRGVDIAFVLYELRRIGIFALGGMAAAAIVWRRQVVTMTPLAS